MTNNQLTKEWLQNRIADMESTRDDIPFGFDESGNNELAAFKLALAAMDSEPVCFVSERNLATLTKYRAAVKVKAEPVMVRPVALYRHAQSAPYRDQVRSEHAEWSQATFGNVGPVGPLKHLSKEALEAAVEPDDLSEWADMQFLLWDAQRRAGITDEQITQAMIEKLAVNKQREWPEPKDGEPRLHIKEQPAPVVDADDNFYSWFGREWAEHYQHNQYTTTAKQMLGVMAESAWKAGRRAAMLQAGNSPVIPDGYVMVPKEPTQAMCAAFNDSDYGRKSLRERYVAMLAAAPHDTPALNSLQSVDSVAGKWIPVSERMPEDRTQVILWDAEIGEVTSGHYSHKTQTFYHCGDAIQNEITHWMLPPSAPQEVNHG